MRLLLFSLAIAACAAVSAPVSAQQSPSSTTPTCASGDPVVWVNTNTKKYHMQGDSYYGKTKHGKYLCKSAADSAGDKAAKMSSSKAAGATTDSGSAPSPVPSAAMGHKHRHSSSGAATGTNMNTDSDGSPSPAPSGMMGHKHHRHHSGSSASPSPDAAPSPAAT